MRGVSLELLGASLELLGVSLELLEAPLELLGASLELRGASACSTSLINWRASQPCSLRLNWASMGSKGFKLSMGVGAKARDDTSGAMHAQCGGDGKARRC